MRFTTAFKVTMAKVFQSSALTQQMNTLSTCATVLIDEYKKTLRHSTMNRYGYDCTVYTITDPFMLARLTSVIAGTAGIIADCNYTGNECHILVDPAFYNRSQRMQDAILAHEVGHRACGHLTGARVAVEQQHVLNEVEADVYAASKGYKNEMLSLIAEAITTVRALPADDYKRICLPDLERRLVALRMYR